MYSEEQFISIIKEHEGLIYKVAKLYTSGIEDEQDLYQEIIYQLWKSFPSFKNDSKISTWMYRVALNTSIANLNKAKKRGVQMPIDETLLNRPDIPDMLKQERVDQLYSVIKKLDPIDKGIIILHLEGNNYDEIAAITGFTSTNVGTRLGRIKQKLISQIKN
jgi:RNA polymerase sigma factor (sigma-70 family)